MITGKTIIRREVVDKPESENILRFIEADVVIVAIENRFQWLHLIDGGWVNAGARQQYIKWQVVREPPDPLPQPTPIPAGKLIKGKTVIRQEVVDKPGSENVLRIIGPNVNIIATENQNQWLHLIDGGWVNAGPGQRYIRWDVVNDTPPAPPPAPVEINAITEIKRKGRIATLLVDWQNPKWNSMPRQFGRDSIFYPQTVTFNGEVDVYKGSRVPLTPPMIDYLTRLNGEKITEKILVPSAGWINRPTIPPTIERLTWAANHVVVKETRWRASLEYSNVVALPCDATDLSETFFQKDMRLIVHKFNAVTPNNTMVKLGNGFDCYTPFITNPDEYNGDMWIRSDYLEFWPELPFTLSDGTQIVEYELYGYRTFGVRANGTFVLLRDTHGFRTNWRIQSPEVPV